MIYAIDSNIVSYFIRGDKQIRQRFHQTIMENNAIVIPSVTYYEVRRGFKHKPALKKEKAFDQMCWLYPIGEMAIDAWECATSIYGDSRRIGKPIEDTDILIAAFCIVNAYTLVTHNTKHFQYIDGLQMVDWAS
jgi:predicted nucleic acid-binding protein